MNTVLRGGRVLVLVALVGACSAAASPSGASPTVGSSSSAPRSSSGSPGVTPAQSATTEPSAGTLPSGSPLTTGEAFQRIPATEGVLNAAWISEDRIVVAGFEGPNFKPVILVFRDGSWSPADVPDAVGQIAAIVGFRDGLIAVGNSLPDTRTGYVWASTDGASWRSVATVDGAAFYDVTTHGSTAVIGGAMLDAEMTATAAAWSSADGSTWARVKVGNGAKAAIGTVASTSKGIIGTGDRALGLPRPIWLAPAAGPFAAVENDLNDQLLPTDLVQSGDDLVLVGASGKSGDQHPFVATSTDGRRWKRTNLAQAEGYASALVVANERVRIAGVDDDRLTIWSLAEGRWTPAVVEPSGASVSALSWHATWGLVAVGARDGRHAAWILPGD